MDRILIEGMNFKRAWIRDPRFRPKSLGRILNFGSGLGWKFNPSIQFQSWPQYCEVPQTLCTCPRVCVCAKCWGLHVGRQTYRRHEQQIGRDCTRRAQNRLKSVFFFFFLLGGGGTIYIYIYMYIYIFIFIFILIYIYMRVYIYIYTCMNMYIHIHIYIYIYIYIEQILSSHYSTCHIQHLVYNRYPIQNAY